MFETLPGEFLASHRLADPYLAEAINFLSVDQEGEHSPGITSFIDYSSLGVRHLGDIYEGLLEFQVRVAEKEMVAVKEKGRSIWKNKQDAGETHNGHILRIKNPGGVYIENIRHERRATGSYYTPHYVVEYMVKSTVGPILEERLKQAEGILSVLESLYKKQQRRLGKNESPRLRAEQSESKGRYTEEILKKERDLFNTLFGIKILDPAMGSGHFLVHSVDFIADKLITFLTKYPNNSVIAQIKSMKRQILEDVIKQGVSIDKGRLTEVNLIKRMVMKKCIYGVDLNEMAVELAKLSHWLDSFTLGAPLSFLDHHLKHGNSLIGAINIANLLPVSERYNAFFQAMTNLLRVGEITDTTVSEVEESRRLYKDAESLIYPTKERVNVQIAKHFLDIGNEAEAQSMQWAYKNPQDRLARDSYEKRSLENFVNCQEVAAKKRFFHWELEFPEVFYDATGKKENAGFDVVIGNPPYLNIEEIFSDDREYLMKSGYYTTTIKRMDIFIPFHELSIKLLRNKGAHSFIVPFPLLTQDYGQKLRVFFLDNTRIKRIVDLSKHKIFPDAVVRNIIPLFKKETINSDYPIEVVTQDEDPKGIQKISGHTKSINASQFRDTYENMFRIDLTTELQNIQKKMDSMAIKFREIFVASWGARGIPVEKFHLDDPINRYCKKMVKGGDIDRYELLYSGKWLLYDIEKLYRPSMPEFFENPKIIFQEVTGKYGLIGVYDKEKFYTDHSLICCIPKYCFRGYDGKQLRKHKIYIYENEIDISKGYDILYVLAVMNSQVNGFYFSKFVGYDLNVYPENIEYLPIPRIIFNTPAKNRKEAYEASYNLYKNGKYGAILRWAEDELLENRNDTIHDFLSYLARQMVALNKVKQTIVRRFLNWLEKEIVKGSVDGLKNKTKLKEFHVHSEGTFFEVLKENNSIPDPTPSKIRNLIENEFSQAMARLVPLKDKIESTDQLINQLTYKLYNLGEVDIQAMERPNCDKGNS